MTLNTDNKTLLPDDPGNTTGVSTGTVTPSREQEASINLEKGSSQSLTPTAEAPAGFVRGISGVKWALVCVGLFLGALLYGLDTTIAADVQGPILESLGEIEKLAWVGIGFPMGSVATILLITWAYGLFEIKWLMIASVITFEIGSAICGAAPTMNAMIVGRVIAGIGGSGLYIGALTYVSVFTSMKERPIYNGALGLCWGTGAILGPLVGGGFSESSATWRWAFYINLPLAAAVAPVYIFMFPKFNAQPDTPGLTKLARIDWVGVFLNAGVWVLFQVACTFSGSTWEWKSAGPIAMWVVWGVFLICFIVQQVFSIFTTAEMRLWPVQIHKSRTINLLYFAASACGASLLVAVYYIPLFFVFTRGDSAIQAAVRLLPFICLMIFSVMVSGALLPVFGRYMPFYVLSGVLIIIGASLMHSVIDLSSSTSAYYGFEVIIAIGTGLSMQTAYSVAVVSVEPQEIQSTIGVMNVAQLGGSTIALSLANLIYQNVGFNNLKDALQGYGFSDAEIRGALAGAQSALLEADGKVQLLAIDAIVDTMSTIWILSIVAGAVCLVSGIFMKREKLILQGSAAA